MRLVHAKWWSLKDHGDGGDSHKVIVTPQCYGCILFLHDMSMIIISFHEHHAMWTLSFYVLFYLFCA